MMGRFRRNPASALLLVLVAAGAVATAVAGAAAPTVTASVAADAREGGANAAAACATVDAATGEPSGACEAGDGRHAVAAEETDAKAAEEGEVVADEEVGATGDADAAASLDVILEELEQVQKEIELQQRKVLILQEMRTRYLAGERFSDEMLQTLMARSAQSGTFLPSGSGLPMQQQQQPQRLVYPTQGSPMGGMAAGGGPPAAGSAAAHMSGIPPALHTYRFDDFLVRRVERDAPGGAGLLGNGEQLPRVTAVRAFSSRARIAAAKSSNSRIPPALVFLAVAIDDGTVYFLDTAGEVVGELSTGHAEISLMAFEGSDTTRPTLATYSSTEGSVHVFDLRIWKGNRIVAGRRNRDTSDGGEQDRSAAAAAAASASDGAEGSDSAGRTVAEGSEKSGDAAQRTVNQIQVEALFRSQLELSSMRQEGAEEKEADGAHSVTAMSMHTHRGLGTKIMLGSSSGMLAGFLANGTMTQSMQLEPAEPVLAFSRIGQVLAVTSGHNVALLSLSRFAYMDYTCLGVDSRVLSIVHDSMSTTYLYAALASGDVLVFNAKAQTEDGSATCQLVHKVSSMSAGGLVLAAHLSVARGYLFHTYTTGESHANSTLRVTVYNTTEIRGGDMRYCFEAEWPSTTGLLAESSYHHVVRPTQTFLVVPTTSADGASSLLLLESLLPQIQSTFGDLSWIRLPMLGGGILVVLGYQWMKRKKGVERGLRGFGGGRGGGGGGGSEDDAAAAMNAAMGDMDGMGGMGGMGGPMPRGAGYRSYGDGGGGGGFPSARAMARSAGRFDMDG